MRFEPRTHRLRGWILDFPSQVPRRLLDYPELMHASKIWATPYLWQDKEMDNPIWNWLLAVLKTRTLGSGTVTLLPLGASYENVV